MSTRKTASKPRTSRTPRKATNPAAIVHRAIGRMDVLGQGGTATVFRVYQGRKCIAVKVPTAALTVAERASTYDAVGRSHAPRVQTPQAWELWRHESALSNRLAPRYSLFPREKLVTWTSRNAYGYKAPAIVFECGEPTGPITTEEWSDVERQLVRLAVRSKVVNLDEIHLLRRTGTGTLFLADVASFGKIPKGDKIGPLVWARDAIELLAGEHTDDLPREALLPNLARVMMEPRPDWIEKRRRAGLPVKV